MRFSISLLIMLCFCATIWANSLKNKLIQKAGSPTASLGLNNIFSELASLKKEYQGIMDTAGVKEMKSSGEGFQSLEAGKTDELKRLVEKMIGEHSVKNQVSDFLNE